MVRYGIGHLLIMQEHSLLRGAVKNIMLGSGRRAKRLDEWVIILRSLKVAALAGKESINLATLLADKQLFSFASTTINPPQYKSPSRRIDAILKQTNLSFHFCFSKVPFWVNRFLLVFLPSPRVDRPAMLVAAVHRSQWCLSSLVSVQTRTTPSAGAFGLPANHLQNTRQ